MKYMFQIVDYFNEIDFDSEVKFGKVVLMHMCQTMPLIVNPKYISSNCVTQTLRIFIYK